MNPQDNKKVLIIDDADEFRKLYTDLLKTPRKDEEHFDIKAVSSAEEALPLLSDWNPDLIILDIKLPGMSGFEFYKSICKHNDKEKHIGTIFVTSNPTPQMTAKALMMGADDFCSKANSPIELLARVDSVLRHKKNTDALIAANKKLLQNNEKLAKITITDELSGLYNMRYFKRRLNQEYLRSERYDKFLSILMFDIDNFKLVNDTADHLMGSYVLAEIGKIVTKHIRTVDIGARFGGDEYVILLPETGPEGALNAAVRIADGIKHTLFDNGHSQYKVTISLGISTMGPGQDHFENGVEFLRRADEYLYEAKETGRDKIVDKSKSQRKKK